MITPGTIVNDIGAHMDFIPTFAAAAGDTDLVDNVRKGTTLNGKPFKVHLDGVNLLPFLKGDVKESPREGFLYWSDDSDLMALRYKGWKIAFLEQNTQISLEFPVGVWSGPFTKLRVPKLYNLCSDPFERGPESIEYALWSTHRMFIQVPAQALIARYLESFRGSRRAPSRRASRSATRWKRLRLSARGRTDGETSRLAGIARQHVARRTMPEKCRTLHESKFFNRSLRWPAAH